MTEEKLIFPKIKPSLSLIKNICVPTILGALLSIMAIAMVSSMLVKSDAGDEPEWLKFGFSLLVRGSHSGGNHPNLAASFMAFPLLFLRPWHYEHNLFGDRFIYLLRYCRLVAIAITIAGGILVFNYSSLLFGKNAGLLSLFLYCFCPTMLAHGRLCNMDMITNLLFLLATFALWRFMLSPDFKKMILTGLALGFALWGKAMNLLLIPIYFLLMLFQPLNQENFSYQNQGMKYPSFIRRFLYFLLILLIALLILNIGYRFDGTFDSWGSKKFRSTLLTNLRNKIPSLLPTFLPSLYLDGLDLSIKASGGGRYIFLAGRYSNSGFWYYYPFVFAIKTPVPIILLLFALPFIYHSELTKRRRHLIYLLFPPFALFFVFNFFNQAQEGLRHILAIYPTLHILFGIYALWNERISTRYNRAIILILLSLALIWYAVDSLSIYPHYLAYFNYLIGGPEAGYKFLDTFNLDWNQDQMLMNHFKRLYPKTILNPGCVPVKGLIAVRTNLLKDDCYNWLKDNFTPIRNIGYTWYIYRVSDISHLKGEYFQPKSPPPSNLKITVQPLDKERIIPVKPPKEILKDMTSPDLND